MVVPVDALDAILRFPNPSVNYTLSVTLRLDIFYGASLPSPNSHRLPIQSVSSHGARSFSDMFATYNFIEYSRTSTYVVGWTVYNVTRGLSPDNCLGRQIRIKQIRKVIDKNSYP
ncbi:hypothetical protein MRX96_015410 [Rhipicephalus microplus]